MVLLAVGYMKDKNVFGILLFIEFTTVDTDITGVHIESTEGLTRHSKLAEPRCSKQINIYIYVAWFDPPFETF